MSERICTRSALWVALTTASLTLGCTTGEEPVQAGTVVAALKCKSHGPSAKPARVHAALAGESRDCKALGIAACHLQFAGWAGDDAYYCFNAKGKQVAVVPVSEAAATLPCSQAQLDAWVAAYDAPCWRLVAASALPASAITLLLDPEQMPPHVCSNIDGTVFRFSSACADHTYEMSATTGGGNFAGTHWSLDITPPTTASLKAGYPFLACSPAYAAANALGCNWAVSVAQDAEHLAIHANDVTHPCGGPIAWQDVLDLLTTSFTTCTADYAW